jgi:hypothetical protein
MPRVEVPHDRLRIKHPWCVCGSAHALDRARTRAHDGAGIFRKIHIAESSRSSLHRVASAPMFDLVVMTLSFSPGSLSTRRDMLAQFVAGAAAAAPLAAHAVSARTGTSSVFTGEYDDPNHPGCLRSVKVVGPKVDPAGRKGRNPVAYVKGVDTTVPGKYMCDRVPELSEVWKLEGKVSEDGESISIDFSPKTKGEVGMLIGKWDTFGSPGITFPDGNKCTPARPA